MRRALEVRIGDHGVDVRAGRGPRAGPLLAREQAATEDWEAALAEAGESLRARVRAASVRVLLSGRAVQRRRLDGLPPVRTTALAQLVSLQAARFFRRGRGELVTGARWRGHPAWSRRRIAEAFACEAGLIEACAAFAERLGGELVSVRAEGSPCELLPPHRRRSLHQRRLASLRPWLLANAVVWLAVVGTDLGRLHAAERRLGRELDSLATPRLAIDRARRELDAARRMVDAVEGGRARRGLLRRRVLRIALALPDSAAILTLSLDRRGQARLTGVAAQAIEVVAALERADLGPVRLDDMPSPDPAPGRQWERFSLTIGAGGDR